MIIFGSILITFESSSIFGGSWAALKIGLSLKSIHHREIQLAQICETLYCSVSQPVGHGAHLSELPPNLSHFV